MRKNSEERTQERINLIVDTALKLYREKSSATVSVLEICKACRMTKPTFYKYVESKEMILANYFHGSAQEALQDMEEMDADDHLSRIFYGVTYGLRKAERNDSDLLKSYLNFCLKEHQSSGFCGDLWKSHILRELDLAKESCQIQTNSNADILFKALGALALGMGIQKACDDDLEEDETYNAYIQNASSMLLPENCGSWNPSS